MAKDLAIILNNGSLNSAVATALAAQKYRPIMVYADLAATPLPRNRAAYDQQVGHFKPYREHTLSLPFLAALHTSADAQSVDPRHSGQLAPQLLALLPILSAAAALAAHYQAAAVYSGLRIGVNADDLAQATEYIQICNELLQLPCRLPDLEMMAPLLEMELWQVADVGVQIGAPLDRTWSCLEQTADPCGICRGCRTREAAFQQAAKPDPIRPLKKA
jgi:7-cyano-7-deazaguanine synthase